MFLKTASLLLLVVLLHQCYSIAHPNELRRPLRPLPEPRSPSLSHPSHPSTAYAAESLATGESSSPCENVCETARCFGYLHAICVTKIPDCSPRFFIRGESGFKEVTDDCGTPPTKPPSCKYICNRARCLNTLTQLVYQILICQVTVAPGSLLEVKLD